MSKYSEFKKKKQRTKIEVEEIDETEGTYDDILEDFDFLKKRDEMSIIEDDFELQYNLDYIRSNDKDAYDKYRQDVKKKRVELSVWTLPTLKQYKEKEEERIRDFSVKPYYIVKGIVPCAKCKCDEMMTFQVQSRGMDEGMTAIYVCTKCQHTFSMS